VFGQVRLPNKLLEITKQISDEPYVHFCINGTPLQLHFIESLSFKFTFTEGTFKEITLCVTKPVFCSMTRVAWFFIMVNFGLYFA